MARFVFWNMARKPQLTLASAIIHQNQVDVFLTAEFGGDGKQLAERVASGDHSFRYLPSRTTSGLSLLSAASSCQVQLLADLPRTAVYEIQGIHGGEPVLLFLVHLPSKLYQSPEDQTAIAGTLAAEIRRFEIARQTDRTILVGDFNMSPFENGMTGARELHGVCSARIAAEGSRKVRGQSYPYFYNPAWALIASRRHASPGTYHYSRSGHYEHFWHTFDQVLIRPSLMNAFNLEALQIVTSAGNVSLLDERGRPDMIGASDHLPILFDLDIECGVH